MQALNDERLEKAKSLHKKCCSPDSLKLIALESICNSAPSALILGKSCNIKLPVVLKNELLEHFLRHLKPYHARTAESVKHIHDFVLALLNKGTKKLDLDNWNELDLWSRNDGSQVVEMMEMVVQQSPNLEHLELHCYFFESDEATRQQVIQCIEKLHKLTHLSLTGLWWITSELVTLPLSLPNLELLKLHEDREWNGDELNNLRFLKKLKELQLLSWEAPALNNTFNWCVENIPGLLLFGSSARYDKYRVRGKSSPCPRLNDSLLGPYQLEHLNCMYPLPKADLPNLKYLYLNCIYRGNDHSMLQLTRYPQLTELVLLSHPFDVLQTVGHRLTQFTFNGDQHQTNDYFNILRLCPNLQHLVQLESFQFVHDSGFRSVVPVPQYLEKCVLMFGRTIAPIGLLKLIFRASTLQSIKLGGLKLCTQTFLELESLDLDFPNLKEILFDDISLAEDCELQMFIDLIIMFICSSPKLERVYVRWQWGTEIAVQWHQNNDVKAFIDVIDNKMRHGKVSTNVASPDALTGWE